MASLKDIRRRIGSVKNTQKITKAMKLVAAAKFARANSAVTASRPYGEAFDRNGRTYYFSYGFKGRAPSFTKNRHG